VVTLTRADVHPTPSHQITLKCPQCSREYRLNYSEDEWHRVNSMLKLATWAIREDHKKRHESDSIDLPWNPIRSGW
jgi:hypothetical protein